MVGEIDGCGSGGAGLVLGGQGVPLQDVGYQDLDLPRVPLVPIRAGVGETHPTLHPLTPPQHLGGGGQTAHLENLTL